MSNDYQNAWGKLAGAQDSNPNENISPVTVNESSMPANEASAVANEGKTLERAPVEIRNAQEEPVEETKPPGDRIRERGV